MSNQWLESASDQEMDDIQHYDNIIKGLEITNAKLGLDNVTLRGKLKDVNDIIAKLKEEIEFLRDRLLEYE